MKARSAELLDRAIAAAVAAIEIYNKPDFPYRGEAFAVLAINGWELILKAKWLADHRNKITSLFVFEPRLKLDGSKSKLMQVKKTRSGNAFTHSLDFLAKRMVEDGQLDPIVWKNLQLLIELRDSAIHFYNRTEAFPTRLQEIGSASLKNFVAVVFNWFGRDLAEFNFYLMPLSFMVLPRTTEGIVLNMEEKRFLAFVDSLDTDLGNRSSSYSVTINIDVRFTKSTSREALGVQLTTDPSAPAVRLTDEQVKEKFPWDYGMLTAECQKRYKGFKVREPYHQLRKSLLGDDRKRFGINRYLDPGNPKSSKKPFFSPNILQEFDKHYERL